MTIARSVFALAMLAAVSTLASPAALAQAKLDPAARPKPPTNRELKDAIDANTRAIEALATAAKAQKRAAVVIPDCKLDAQPSCNAEKICKDIGYSRNYAVYTNLICYD